jgi:hypothetical protein
LIETLIETLIKLRLFTFVSSEPAKHKLHSFVTHPQRQNSTQFRAQIVAKEDQKRA